jgi:hypothetical protein
VKVLLRLTRRSEAAVAIASATLASATLGVVGACASFESGGPTTGADAADAEPAAPDAGPDATPTFSCAALQPKPTFCNDFDEQPFLGGFSMGNLDAGEAGLDTTFARSPPNSFVARTAACDTTCGERYAALLYGAPVASPYVQVAFDLYIESDDPNGTGYGPQAVVIGYAAYYYVVLDLSPVAGKVTEVNGTDAGAYVDHPFDIHAITFGKWHRIALSVSADDAGPGGDLALSVDGNAVPLLPDGRSQVAGMYRASGFSVELGIKTVAPPAANWTVHIDDVVIDQH